MGLIDDFLVDLDPRRWAAPEGTPRTLTTAGLFLGGGDYPLEVAMATSVQRPRAEDVRKLWHGRQGKRPSPLVLIIAYPEHGATRLTVCGPVGDQPPLINDLEPSQIERLAAAALAEPNRHAAIRFLVAMLPEVGTDLPGLRNSGLLASQELRSGVPQRADWSAACSDSAVLLPMRGRQLVEKLGFTVEQLSVTSSVLKIPGGTKRAVAVFLDEGETFDGSADRFGTSPVSHAMALADREGVPWVVLTRSRQIRLYAARSDTGVGRKGRAETFVEINLALLPVEKAGYLGLLFSSTALAANGTLEEVLQKSADFAADLAVRLRERVYFEAIPGLARAVAKRLDPTSSLNESDLSGAYEQALVILFRLLFVAYAEDKDLLPYRTNSRYTDHALKTIARRLAEDKQAKKLRFDASAIDHWEDVRQLWRAVDKGNTAWGVPGYNGGLFSSDPAVNSLGAALTSFDLTDAEFGPALLALLVDEGPDGVIGPVDFRSLSVREFGTIYEGLLESRLSIAPTDLGVDTNGNYIPTTPTAARVVEAGEIYFHNRSGARKASGSYFTKPFAVEHLLNQALEPALADHLRRLQSFLDVGDEAAASDAFFDFRCVDLAMGSGHFLVAAVDRIEARLSGFLSLHPIAPINAELERLRQAAIGALGDLADGVEIETSSLLRRQVARRCVYGVDMNHVSVELARLAIWIHTFVPGLPLSFLDHSLVCGDSLTGIGTLDEAADVLDPKASANGVVSLFRGQIEEFLDRAGDALRRLALTTEATVADVDAARAANAEAWAKVQPAKDLFDLLVSGRLGHTLIPVTADEHSIEVNPGLPEARRLSAELSALHFPVAFPEVFLRERPGFDCILGNPPWEEATVEELQFWSIRFPGLKAMSNVEQKDAIQQLTKDRPDLGKILASDRAKAVQTRSVLTAGAFPGMGTGDPDLYKAFLWRFVHLCRERGRLGVVVPRSVFAAKGSAPWRLSVLPSANASIVFTKNRGEWLFTDVNPGYPVVLLALQRLAEVPRLEVRGIYESLEALTEGIAKPATSLDVDVLMSVDENLCIPIVEDEDSLRLFAILIKHPAFGATGRLDFRARPQTELHATNDAREYFTNDPAGLPVHNHLNVGHFRFNPDAGSFNYTDRTQSIEKLLAKRRSLWGKKASPVSEMSERWVRDPTTLPALCPRIVLRDVVHSTNPRKIWAALAPRGTVVTNKAPYLLFPRGDLEVQAYLLGILGSSVCDWFGHLRVNLNLNFFILNTIPIPVFNGGKTQRRIAVLAASLAVGRDDRKTFGDWVDLAISLEDPHSALAELDALASLSYGVPDELIGTIWNVPTRPPADAVREWRLRWSEKSR